MSSTEGTVRFRSSVRAYLQELPLARGACILVACSAGPDSTALLDVLCSLAGEWDARVLAAYLDHGIRSAPEREAERAAAAALAGRCAVPLLERAVEPGLLEARARSLRASLEEVARRERYAFLEAAADGERAAAIAVGHTADDAAETVLMRVLQGVDVSGLGGIPERRGRLIRPLCRLTRRDVLEYLDARGLPFVTDASNADPRYLRNRLRSEILPAVSVVFPSYRRSLLALARKAREAHRLIQDVASERIRWVPTGEGLAACWEDFASAAGEIRGASAYAALDRLGAGRIPYRFLEPLRGPLSVAKRGTLLAGCGYRFARRGAKLYLEPDVVRRRKIGYLVHVRAPGDYALPECGIVVRVVHRQKRGHGMETGRLVVRSRRPGDRVRLASGWASVGRVAERCRLPERTLDLLPIVANPGGIERVIGSALGCADAEAYRETGNAPGDPAVSVAITLEEQ